ncbi:protein TolR [Sphingomonas sp. MG17]|uniref:Protein TolR n=1 Tax=Sphingomonas tagetis TaxID=2949092 RepID=A0A9X2HHK1_9SPHN|nr:protein TolR [Sphingomonas tagetis]MCP3730067.1 protein TolR [Sphingomonas tagetis]
MGAQLPSARGKGRRAPMADINVTPLVDVMLVLLIIFMVTAPLLTAGVPVNLPESKAKPLDQDQEPVQISIDEKGAIYLDNSEVTEAGLGPLLEEIAAKRGEDKPQIFVRADTRLQFGKVMRVMGELNRVGLNKVSLVTTPVDGR